MNHASVLDCGSPLPLSHPSVGRTRSQSARGLAQSKTWRPFVAALVFLVIAITAHAQPYAIDWFTIDGGGGTSTGGVYSVSGTIGQPDAGVMSSGPYSLVGGFWGVTAIQTPGAPLLSVTNSSGTVVVSWPRPADGFVLDQTMALSSPPASIPWSQVSVATYQTNATHIFISLPAPDGNKYYRLRKP